MRVAQRLHAVVRSAHGLSLTLDDGADIAGKILLERILELGHGVILAFLGGREHGLGIVAGHGVLQAEPPAVQGTGHGAFFFDLEAVAARDLTQFHGELGALLGETSKVDGNGGVVAVRDAVCGLLEALASVFQRLDEVLEDGSGVVGFHDSS